MPTGTFTLVVEDRFGALTDEYRFESGELTIGRSRQCDIVLPSENVSRRHARIFTQKEGLFIEDLRSANGVFVNGKRVFEATELTDKSVARVGDYHLHVHGARKLVEEHPVYLRLVGRNLSVADEMLEITNPTTLVGRGKDCGLVLVDPSMSRVHARLVVRPDGTILAEDVGSANGVFVNGQRIKVWQLREGDILRFGNLEFLVEIPTANTVETLGASQGGAFERAGRWVVSHVAWVIVGMVLTAVLVLAILIITQPSRKKGGGDAAPPPPVAETAPESPSKVVPAKPVPPPQPKKPAEDPLAEARKLLADGKLEEAAAKANVVQAADASNMEAVRLSNRIAMEGTAKSSLLEGESALAKKDFKLAAQSLLRVPEDSVFRDRAATGLKTAAPKLVDLRKRACNGGSAVDCIQLKALEKKLAKFL
jgi:pSer/pThr/pTyr-binding forkhead associated (FHA) protein